jgi:2-phospho-L-lactate guanylyltransferase
MRVAAIPSLGLDVDTPDDLAALRAALAARPGGARRTRALLAPGSAAAPAA